MSTAFDRLENATEAALYDADPAGYSKPYVPWFLISDGRVDE